MASLKASLQQLELTSVRYTNLWEVTRKNDSVLRFTDHNSDVEYEEQTFQAAGGFQASAVEAKAQLQERNVEIVGAISTGGLTEADILSGLYDDAEVVHHVVDWRQPWLGAYITMRYRLASFTWTGSYWKAEMVDEATLLARPVGRIFTKTCPHVFGDSKCQATPTTKTGTITFVDTDKYSFRATFTDPQPANGEYVTGDLTFASGAANGEVMVVKQHLHDTDVDVHDYFEFYIKTQGTLAIGDSFTVKQGCNHTLSDCVSRFSNVTNFGGFPHIPGTDKTISSPRVKL